MFLNRRKYLQLLSGCAILSSAHVHGGTLAHARENNFRINGYEVEFTAMGSRLNIRWYSDFDNTQQVLELARVISDKWVMILSDYEPESESMLACQRADQGEWVQVSDDLWTILQICDQWNRNSRGAFDAALGALTQVRRQRKPVPKERWDAAKLSSGWKHLEFDPTHRQFRTKTAGLRFDFGAIGKGYVADQISHAIAELGIEPFAVNASGNMRFGKAPPEASGWPVSIDIPPNQISDPTGELLRARFSRCGIATSGDGWQRFPDSIPDKSATKNRTSHIIDPNTLLGIAEHHNIFVVAANATDADAIATISSVLSQSGLAEWFDTIARLKPEISILVCARSPLDNTLRVRHMFSSTMSR